MTDKTEKPRVAETKDYTVWSSEEEVVGVECGSGGAGGVAAVGVGSRTLLPFATSVQTTVWSGVGVGVGEVVDYLHS